MKIQEDSIGKTIKEDCIMDKCLSYFIIRFKLYFNCRSFFLVFDEDLIR